MTALTLDRFLAEVVPELKLALGERIDRENARPVPPRYARLLPETLLVVTLRPDVADLVAPVVAQLEAELTESVRRHGSLYDRAYRVQLRRAVQDDAPLFAIHAFAGQNLAPAPAAAVAGPPRLLDDPEATRLEAPPPAAPGWEPGRWLLVVEGVRAEPAEVFVLVDPLVTVGRRTDDPELRSTVALTGVPHVSRRQLALQWAPRDGAPGWRVVNLGQAPVRLPDRLLPGARWGRRPLDLAAVPPESQGWVAPDRPIVIGDAGPTLYLREAQPGEDPEATRYG